SISNVARLAIRADLCPLAITHQGRQGLVCAIGPQAAVSGVGAPVVPGVHLRAILRPVALVAVIVLLLGARSARENRAAALRAGGVPADALHLIKGAGHC